MKRALISFILLLSLQCSVWAIHPPVKNYNRKVINAGTQSWDIIQHENNWIYFANNNGLLEFDGIHWNVYPIRNYTTVRALCYDERNERIYAGAFNEFGYYSRSEAGLMAYHSLSDSLDDADREFNEIWAIAKADDFLYFQGEKEIFRYKNEQIKKFSFKNRIECTNVVYNTLFIAVENETVLMQSGDLFISLPNADILKNKKICAILPIHETDLLFVTDFDGMFLFDGERVIPYKTDIDAFLKESQIFCATIHGNKLAIGTVTKGLVVKNLDDNSTNYLNIYSGLQNNTVLSLMFDRQDNLWLGLDIGVDYVMISSPVYDLYGSSQLYGTGYASLVKDHLLYLGTNQGLYVTEYPLRNRPESARISLLSQMQGQVWSIREIDNTVFCGNDHGAFVIDGNKVRKLDKIPGTWNFKELKAHPGYILGSSYQGFFILKKVQNEWQFSHFVDGFTDNGGMYEEDEEGNIWFAHWIKGIIKLTLNEQLTSFSVEAFDTSKGFYVDRNNSLFKIDDKVIFSSDGGFFEYDKANNKVKHAKQIESVFGIFPHSIMLYKAPKGDIWAISATEIQFAALQSDATYKIDRTSFSRLKNKLIPGFTDINFVDDTHLIINTFDGFSWIDPYEDNSIKENFKIAIKRIYLTHEKDSLIGGYLPEQKEIPEIKHKNNSIRFEFVASEYRVEGVVNYSYYLQHYDTDWSAFSATTTKEYTKLPKGDYTFKVKAQNIITGNVAEATYDFVILPPWYQSWGALLIYFILCIFGLYLLLILVQKKSQHAALEMKELKEKEMQEQEERFQADSQEKEKEIVKLKNQKLQYELRHKSQDLASSTMNLIRKNEILMDLNNELEKITENIKKTDDTANIQKQLLKMQENIKANIERDDNWKKFETNFDLVYENYLKRLGEAYPVLTVNDKKLCAYLKMGLSSKDIAPLMNMSFRSVEMSRYRLRKKLDLDRDVNLTDFLQNF